MSVTQTRPGFDALGLPPGLLARLQRLGFVTPTPIQREAIPVALSGRDVVGLAQTGTGKTLAFGLPIAVRLQRVEQALVLAPTRELALQIEETMKQIGLRTALLIGGAPMARQIQQINSRPQVIVATPGRLFDHIQQRSVDLRMVSIVVLDEADRMLDMGFAPTIRKILQYVPKQRQTLLFSATMPNEIADIAKDHLSNPLRIEVERAGSAATLVTQELVVVDHGEKPAMLGDLLRDHDGTILVFARTRHGARKLAKAVRHFGHSAAELHSDRSLAQRREALDGFKDGSYRVLVATDIAARGIDVKEIELVVNYDLPDNPEDYVHRIGRTGRAGSTGRAITLATPDQHRDVWDIEKLLQSELPLSSRSRMSIPRRPAPKAPVPRAASSRHQRPNRNFRPAR